MKILSAFYLLMIVARAVNAPSKQGRPHIHTATTTVQAFLDAALAAVLVGRVWGLW